MRKTAEDPPKKKTTTDPKKAKADTAATAARNTEELAKAQTEKQMLDQQIADKNKEMDAIRVKYDEYKRRFAELKAKETSAKR